MAKEEDFAKIAEGVTAWNEWRSQHPQSSPDLVRAKLRGADLTGVNLAGADLRGADLTGTVLAEGARIGADLSGADLTRANLRRAVLVNANLSSASLGGADLRDTDLSGADLSRAGLIAADLAGASAHATLWADVDLSAAVNLDSIVHRGPSTIGIDTFYRSKGGIPEVFLRGCGVSGNVVALQQAIMGAAPASQFYSCFISYSHRDEAFATRLHGRLQQAGLRVWFAPEEMKGGRKLHEQIDEAIRMHDKLLLVVSEASMASEWVATEMRKARKREGVEKRRVLFPIRLVDYEALKRWECFDADAGKDMAVEVREFYIPDFANWKNDDAFESEFGKLLGALKASDEAGLAYPRF
jgi:hypothetical protein